MSCLLLSWCEDLKRTLKTPFIGLALYPSTGARLSEGRKLEEDRCFPGIEQGDSPAPAHVQGQVRAPSNPLQQLGCLEKAAQGCKDISQVYPPSSELPQPETVSTAQEPSAEIFSSIDLCKNGLKHLAFKTSCGEACRHLIMFLWKKKVRGFCLPKTCQLVISLCSYRPHVMRNSE